MVEWAMSVKREWLGVDGAGGVKTILVSFAMAFGGPILMNAIVAECDAAAVRELAAWLLMLFGLGGAGLALRSRQTIRVLRPSQYRSRSSRL